ncbi:MAG: hypothetical protein ACFB11_17765 [Paracoccaceae bacterium]
MSFNIEFDYRFDTSGFFQNASARAAMEEAGRIWESIIRDEFDDVPAGTRFTVRDPSRANATASVTLDRPIDDVLVFVGARDLMGPLARGGYTGVDAEGDIYDARISGNFRGKGPVTDFEPWAGTVVFDTGVNWNFNLNSVVDGRFDFITVALHEIGHVLGIGTAPIFDQLGAGALFRGVNATRVNGGDPVPLEFDLAHVEDGFDRNQVLLDPRIAPSNRLLPSQIDMALLADIGYEIAGFVPQGFTPSITTPGNDQTVFGTITDDLIVALAGDDRVQGSEGQDTLLGGQSDDTLFGQSGDDLIEGNTENDQLSGGDGEDTLLGGPGADLLFGGAGNDYLEGGSGTNSVSGDSGNDTLFGGRGNDRLWGDSGTDSFVVIGNGGRIRIQDLNLSNETISLFGSGFASPDAVVDAITKPFTNLSRITFLDGTILDVAHSSQSGTPLMARHFSLDPEGELRIGASENDTIATGSGADTLRGGDGGDTLISGAGDDMIMGGTTSADRRDLILAGSGNDSVNGGFGNDELRGEDGNDTLDGGFGVDTVIGGNGDDALTGGAFSDLMFGGSGSDFINGGFGSDRVNGGADGDRFYHLGILDHGSDWIQDFDNAQFDRLVFGSSASSDDFQVNLANTPGAGSTDVLEAFIIYRPTEQILWALVDGGALDEIVLRLNGSEFDLLA